MKKTTKAIGKTVTIPVKLAEQILDDMEMMQTELFKKKPFGIREFTLASAHDLSAAVGWETPSSALNTLLKRDRAKLRKAFAGDDMTDVEMAIECAKYFYEKDKAKNKKPRKAAK